MGASDVNPTQTLSIWEGPWVLMAGEGIGRGREGVWVQPAINGGRALSPPYISSCTRGWWWWRMPGVQLVSYLRGCTGCTWVPHQLSVGGANKTVQTLSRLQSSPASHCKWMRQFISRSIHQFLANHANPSIKIQHDVISSPAPDLWDCSTNTEAAQRSINSCQIGGVCFLHLGGLEGGEGAVVSGKHEHVSHAHIKAIEVALYIFKFSTGTVTGPSCMLFIQSLYYLRGLSVNAECTILEVNLDVGTCRVPKTLIVNLILSLSWQNQSFDNTAMSKLFDAAEEFMNQLLRWGFANVIYLD